MAVYEYIPAGIRVEAAGELPETMFRLVEPDPEPEPEPQPDPESEPEPLPAEGLPDAEWSIADIRAFAQKHGVELPKNGNKAQLLAAFGI